MRVSMPTGAAMAKNEYIFDMMVNGHWVPVYADSVRIGSDDRLIHITPTSDTRTRIQDARKANPTVRHTDQPVGYKLPPDYP